MVSTLISSQFVTNLLGGILDMVMLDYLPFVMVSTDQIFLSQTFFDFVDRCEKKVRSNFLTTKIVFLKNNNNI